jgi:small conductance mechanosensitive channel
VIMTFGLVFALEALGFSLGLLGSLLLLLILLVVLAARPLLQDLGAGLIIQLRRPFSMGDQVAIDGVEGRIDEVSARTVRIITVDGRRVHFPNRKVLEDAITNLTTEGQRLTTFIVGAAYDTDLDRAREVIVAAMESASTVLSTPVPEAFVQEFSDSTINIACRFWHAPEIQAEWVARDEAMRAVKRALDANGMTIAFPQRVVWAGGATG